MNIRRVWTLAHQLCASSVAWGVARTLLRGVGFFVVMAYALRIIPSKEMGFWYVMLSLTGLGGVVEFGFTATISRYTSYYSGGATAVPSIGTIQFEAGAMNARAIAGLVRMARRLYLLFGLVVGVSMLVGWMGWHFWGAAQAQDVGPRVTVAFLLLVFGTAFDMTGAYWSAILYGMNRVQLFNQCMVAGLVANYTVALVGLIAGGGILALVAGQIAGTLVPRVAARRLVLRSLKDVEPSEARLTSWRELWPTTWRAGVIPLCTYLMFGTTTVLCSVFAGIEMAARYGLTMQMALMLHATSTLWVWVKIPEISTMRVQGNWKRVLDILRRRLPLSLMTYASSAAVVVVVAPSVLRYFKTQTDMLPGPEMVAFLVLIGLDVFVSLHSVLLQTGNEVPHLRAFCLSACLSLLLAWPLGTRFQVWGVMGAPFLAQVMVNYWWVPYQFWSRLQTGLGKQREAAMVPSR